tara:strand:- start:5 stop:202 length:198 start_codon:yes stop_codon:yes gene_type:complete
MTETPREPEERGRKIVLEIELDDHIANGLIEMKFRSQTSGRQDVWDARGWVAELINRYREERDTN